MRVREIDVEQDYPMLVWWWENHGWTPINKNILPPFGWVIEEDGEAIAASFAYMDNGGTGVAMIEWTVADPEASPRTVVKALPELMTFMTETLRGLDYTVVLSSCRQEGLAKILEKVGFVRTDDSVIHLIKTWQ